MTAPRVVRRRGRPAVDRLWLLVWVTRKAGQRRNIVYVNERTMAREFGCHRSTVIRALADLEDMGLLTKRRYAGRAGVVLQLTDHGRELAEYDMRQSVSVS